MANDKQLEEWSMDGAGSINGFPVPDGAPENWHGEDINSWGREIMAVIRRWYDDPEWISITRGLTTRAPKQVEKLDASSFRILSCDATAYFTAGRRVRMRSGSVPPYAESHVNSVGAVMSGNHTVVTIIAANVPATFQPDGADVYFGKTLDPSAFIALPSVGDLRLTAGLQSAAASDGWLECNGDEYLFDSFPGLGAVLGSTGAQDGNYDKHPVAGLPTIGYFRVPDMAGRVPVGYWDVAHPLGQELDLDYDNDGDQDKSWYGEKTHELTMDEMPEHDHDASTTAGGAHSHTLEITSSVSTGVSGISSNVIAPAQNTVYNDEIIQDEAAHIHALTVQGDAANNLVDMRQPSIVMGYVIYSGVIP